MANFAPNYTPRLRVKYSSLGVTHTVLFRDARGVQSASGLVGKISSFLAALQSILYTDWTVLGADWADEDSDLFLPVTPPDQPVGAWAIPSQIGQARTVAISYCGRTAAGGKARFFIYGTGIFFDTAIAMNQDFRSSAVELPVVAATTTVLNTGAQYLRGNDDAVVTWYPYINFKSNNYQVRKARRG